MFNILQALARIPDVQCGTGLVHTTYAVVFLRRHTPGSPVPVWVAVADWCRRVFVWAQ